MDTPETLLAAAREQIAGLTAAAESNAAALADHVARIGELESANALAASAVESLKAENAALSEENAALKAEARSAEQRAAEIAAKAGIEAPVEIKPVAKPAAASAEEQPKPKKLGEIFAAEARRILSATK